jgi:hypothetical protein
MPVTTIEELAGDFDGTTELSARATIGSLLAMLERLMPAEVECARISRITKYPFKASCLEAILGWRILELSRDTVALYDQGRDLASVFTCRGVMESAALLLQLGKRLEYAVRERRLGDADDFFMRGLYGWNAPYSNRRPLSISTAIGHATKAIPAYSSHYAALSDFVHPNYAGAHATYATLDEQYLVMRFGERRRLPWEHVLLSLIMALLLALHAISRMREAMPKFIEISDRHVQRFGDEGASPGTPPAEPIEKWLPGAEDQGDASGA